MSETGKNKKGTFLLAHPVHVIANCHFATIHSSKIDQIGDFLITTTIHKFDQFYINEIFAKGQSAIYIGKYIPDYL